MNDLIDNIRSCTICLPHLPHGCNPVCSFATNSKIAIVGQAPGRIVHESGVPWQDKSGDTLRKWLGVSDEQFYDSNLFAIVPMGFCYPGKGKSGDLPPRPECAPQWHNQIFKQLQSIELTLLIGTYAQHYYLPQGEKTLTERVRNFHRYLPNYFPLPHPSPRNNIWIKKNPWFGEIVIPALAGHVQQLMS